MKNNSTMMQYFEWYLPADSKHWKRLLEDAQHLSNIGIDTVWLPPAFKCSGGASDPGYGVYDLYDLGEFDQKGSIPTKYGTKNEYIAAINILKNNNIKVLADIVFNHKMGADETEEVLAVQDDRNNRNIQVSDIRPILAWTKYTFPGRGNTYSDFKWNWKHFHGIDWDENTKTHSIYKFYGKDWNNEVDTENGNYDYLMGVDIDFNNLDVINEFKKWGLWYINLTNIDGVRFDAVKHIRANFFPDWLEYIREKTGKELFTVGEYWNNNIDALNKFLENTNNSMSLFDVPLHYNFYQASKERSNYDMGSILNGTLVKCNSVKAVTFVDNHDTEPGQALESWVEDWFKPLAYSIILLRVDGFPCIFYGDYYGIPTYNICPKNDILDKLLYARKKYAYGEQHDYFDHHNVIGFTREGNEEHPNSGLAVLMSSGDRGYKIMNVGKSLANSIFYDITGNLEETVYVDNDGNGIFYCNSESVSVWVKKEKIKI